MDIQKSRRRLGGHIATDQTFTNLDLRGMVAQQSVWTRCHFVKCKLGQVALGDATFIDCHFVDCDLGQATLVSRLYQTTFTNCNLDQAVLTGADIQGSMFRNCRMEYVNMERATLRNVEMLDCALHGARLDFAESDSVDFTGSNLWGAVIPINCAFWVGNRFDRRSLHMLLGLINRSAGDTNTRDDVRSITDERYERLVNRLVPSNG